VNCDNFSYIFKKHELRQNKIQKINYDAATPNKKTSLNHKFKGGFDEVQVLLKHK